MNTRKVNRFIKKVDLLKSAASVGDVHAWKDGNYKKISLHPPKWEPVKRVSGKWEKDTSRDAKVEGEDKLQSHEVDSPDKKKGRPKAQELVIRETKSQGKIVTVDGKVYKYRGSGEGEISDSEAEYFRGIGKKHEERAQARKEAKAKPKEEAPEPEKKKRRPETPLYRVTERQGGQKWVKLEEGKPSVKYDGDVEVGEDITPEEAEKIKATPKGTVGRKSLEVGAIIQRQHGKVMNLGDVLNDGKRREITYEGSLDEKEVAPEDVVATYTERWKNKQGVKRHQKDLFAFEPRERSFLSTRKKLKRKNPFSPPDVKPDRGTITAEERRLTNDIYMDGDGIQLVKGNKDFITDTNYMSEDIRSALYSHQVDFVNQSMDAFQERKKKAMLNFDGTGAGKTLQQLALAETYIENNYNTRTLKPVFIVTASDRIINNAFLPDAKKLKIKCNIPQSEDEVRPGINVITYSSIHKFAEIAKKSDLVVFDEAHKMKGTGTRSAELGMKLTREAKHAAMFTATPLDKNEHLLYLANSINLDEGKLMSSFGYKYTPPKEPGQQGAWNTNKKFKSQDLMDNIARVNSLSKALEDEGVLVRREKSLSGLKYSKLKVPLDEKAFKETEMAYLQARDLQIAEGDAPAYAYGGKWVQKRRSALENAKIGTALDAIESEIKEGRKVVLFATRASDSYVEVTEGDTTQQKIANLTTDGKVVKTEVKVDEDGVERVVKFYRQTESTIKAIEAGLKKRGITFETLSSSDEESKNKRKADQKIRRFQEGDSQVFITTPQSGGTGLNLDDTTGKSPRTAIITTPPFSASDLTQMLGRIHRLSTKSKSRAILLTSNTATDEWNEGIIDEKMKRLGVFVEGDVGKKLNPEVVKLIEGMDDEQAAEFLSAVDEGIDLSPSDNVKPFKAEDFVSPANQMTQRTFGINDIDVLKEYNMFTDRDVQATHVTTGKFAEPGYLPLAWRNSPESLPLGKKVEAGISLNDRVGWVLPVDRQSNIGKIVCSRSLNHPEEMSFYVVVGKDENNAYAKLVSRDINPRTVLGAMIDQRYGFLGRKARNDFLERLGKDVALKKSKDYKELPRHNGAGYVATPSINRLSDQLMFSLISEGKTRQLYAGNRYEFLETVWQ